MIPREEHLKIARRQHPEETEPQVLARVLYREKHWRRQRFTARARRAAPYVITIGILLLALFVAKAHGQQAPNVNIARVGGTVAPTGLVSANGFKVDIANSSFVLHMVCDSGCGGAATFSDSAAFTFATTSVNNISAVVDDVATNVVAENSAGAVRMNTNRILYIDLSKTAANATAIKVDGSAVTQPVSGTFWQATQPVSGTFWQATQPVSIATMPSTPVTGTFWQATQPVSGTFWQATQPVSIASMPSTPVTGTFWQATQPVSGTFWQATQPISGTVTATQGGAPWAENITQFGSTNVSTGAGAGGAGIPRVTVSNDSTVKLWDGTNTATVKAASTAAAAADPAQVVVQSPNGTNPCHNPSAPLTGTIVALSGTTTTQIIALSGTTKIYICSIVFGWGTGTTPTFALRYGTGVACATGTVTIIPATAITAALPNTFPYPTNFFVTPSGQALCYILTGTTPTGTLILNTVQQ